jgi:hypothetical protein
MEFPMPRMPASRLLAFSATVVLALGPMAAFAGPTENALLASYAGNYVGTGNITGAHAQAVKCRLVLTASQNGKVIYTGRCSTNGAEFSLTGTFAYLDGHYVAAMTGGGATGEVIGQKQGDGVVFKAAKQHSDMGGQSMTVGSTLTLSGGKITVAFSTIDDKTGKASAGTIPFTKS